MALLDILTAPDRQLRRVAAPVAAVDRGVRRLMDDMLETMYAAPGVGLAAPQVGVLQRVVVVDVADREDGPRPLRMANPEILESSDETAAHEEGCLSLPEHFAEVTRPAGVVVSYLDHDNRRRKGRFEGLLATCVQHEIDHLDGVLFVDHLSAVRRGMILRKLAKGKRARERVRA